MLKATMLFQRGVAGWSETFYIDSSSLAIGMGFLQGLGASRQRCLPTFASIIGFRVSDVDNPGLVTARAAALAGSQGTDSDSAYQSLVCYLFANDGRKRVFLLRSIPDNQCALGSYAAIPNFPSRVANFFSTLVGSGFKIRRVDKTQPLLPFISISNAGLLTMPADPTWVDGNTIQLLRGKNTLNLPVHGKFLATKLTATTYTLNGWGDRGTVTIGKVRRSQIQYANITEGETTSRIVSRRVGRPFGAPVGRRKRAS